MNALMSFVKHTRKEILNDDTQNDVAYSVVDTLNVHLSVTSYLTKVGSSTPSLNF